MNGFSTIIRVALAIAILSLATLPVAAQFKFLEIKITDQDGQPVTDAEVEVSLSGTQFPMPTDDKGMLSLNVPEGGDSATRFIVKHEGHVTVGVSWEPGDTIPEQLTIPMEKGVAIGGIVHDEEGNSIEGVKIKGTIVDRGPTDWLPGKGKVVPYLHGEIATTGPDGRWQSTSAPEQPMPLQLKFSHPDYKGDDSFSSRGGTWDELRSLEKIVVLEKGLDLHGTVTNPNGEPVANAKVGFGRGRYYSDYQIVQTDAEGKYSLKNLGEGANTLTVASPDWSPEMRSVTPSKNGQPEDFQLGPPHTVRLRVVDPDGQPIEGVVIFAQQWRGMETLAEPDQRTKTNAEGIWEWRAAPPDEIKYGIHKTGQLGVPEWQARFLPSDEVQDVTMLPAPVVLGTVVDKTTGKPIEEFRYVEGVWWEPNYDSPVLQSHNVQENKEGKFRFVMESGCVKFMMRVEADGYRPVESREILPEEREVALVFEMEPGTGPVGVVKLPDGTPAKGVKVAMATSKQQVLTFNGEIQPDFAAGHDVTDAEGRFEMPFPESDFAIVCIGDFGWAVAYADQDATTVEARLEPWGGLVGIAMRGTEPLSNEEISIWHRSQSMDVNSPRVYFHNQAKTDDSGRFNFERLQSGPATVSRRVRYADRGDTWMSANTHTLSVNILPGRTFAVQLGGMGRKVTGRLTVPADFADEVVWNMGSVSLVESSGPVGAEGFFYQLGQAIGQATAGTSSGPSPRQQENPPTYSAAIGDNGSYEIDDVPPGSYDLRVTLYPKMTADEANWSAVGSLNVRVKIPKDGEEPLNLGEHELKITSFAR